MTTENHITESVEKLREMKSLFSSSECWTKGYYAKNELGNDVGALANGACRWCITGAITKVLDPQVTSNHIFDSLVKNLDNDILNVADDENSCPLVMFNDSPKTTYTDIIELIDKTINYLEAD